MTPPSASPGGPGGETWDRRPTRSAAPRRCASAGVGDTRLCDQAVPLPIPVGDHVEVGRGVDEGRNHLPGEQRLLRDLAPGHEQEHGRAEDSGNEEDRQPDRPTTANARKLRTRRVSASTWRDPSVTALTGREASRSRCQQGCFACAGYSRGTVSSHSVPNEPVASSAVPPSSATLPRTDETTPSRPSARRRLEPALGDARAPRRGRRPHGVRAWPRAAPTPAPPDRRARPRCRGRPTTTATISARPAARGARRRRRRHGHPGSALERRQCRRPGRPSPGVGVDRVLLTDQGPQRLLLLAREPAQLGAVAARARAPGAAPATAPAARRRGRRGPASCPLGRGRGRALGRGRRASAEPQQRVDHEADDRSADEQQEVVPVDGLGQVVAGSSRSRGGEQHRSDQAAVSAASGSPTRTARPSPRSPGRSSGSPAP